MIRRLAGLAMTASFAGCLLLTNTSCAGLDPGGKSKDETAQRARAPTRQKLVQFFFGREASFGVCVEPACPQVTPKTLASATPLTPPVALRPQADPPALAQAPESDSAVPFSSAPRVAFLAQPPSADYGTHRLVVNFPFASSELTPSAKAAISASIEYARNAQAIVIAGRTDFVGSDAINESIALSRAMAVRYYLRGLAPDLAGAITIDAKGRCCFIASNQNADGRSKNRRAEIVFTSRGGA